jgi:hypothetical protein
VTIWSKTPKGKEIQKRSKQKYAASEHGKQHLIAQRNRPEHKAKTKTRLRKQYLRQKASVAGRYNRWDSELRTNYGIDVEDWARLYNNQNRQCAACRRRLNFDKHTHIDHNHSTGKVRGLLCRWCNAAVGHSFENIENLEAIIGYLKSHA